MKMGFPAHTAAFALLVTLPACSTIDAGTSEAGDASQDVRRLVGRSVEGLGLLIADLAAPAVASPAAIDARNPVGLIEDARAAVITAGAMQLDQPGLAAKAELATLTLLLTLCRDRMRSTDGLAAGSAEARQAARMLGQRCYAPLTLMLG